MKASIEFSLPDELHEMKIAVEAHRLYASLNEIDMRCRTLLKHGEYPTREFIEDIRGIVSDGISTIRD
jgi:hypothetical protein